MIKNYTTQISYEKTIMEIETILSKNGATNIFKQYENGVPIKIAFQYLVNDNPINFLLPMEYNKILVLLTKQNIPKKFKTKEQAIRIGWRIIKDWIDAQMALISIKIVEFEQVFLPYMYNMQNNKTLFDLMKGRDYNLSLEYKNSEHGLEREE